MAAMSKDIVVVGASAGGVEALKAVVAGVPSEFRGTIFIVLHVGSSDSSYLAEILARVSKLPVAQAEDGHRAEPGHIYVARPDYHLVLERGTMHLTRGPKENRFRPAVDALFRSAAYIHASRVVGVVLSGALDDGTAGLWWIKERGGTAIVQAPADAQVAAMPESAIRYASPDHVVPAKDIGQLLMKLSRDSLVSSPPPPTKELEVETFISRDGRALQAGVMDLGPITPYTCPECHGVLVQLKEGGVPRFRCHTGHAYSINTLLSDVTEYIEEALWNSIRSIEESAMLLDHLARHVRDEVGDEKLAKLYEQKAKDTLNRADLVRKAASGHQTLSQDNIREVESGSR
jgi:two-component system chemotaxis response regulator CheB